MADPEPAMTIYERLVAILGELPAIGKDARNEQQKFMYRSHDAVLNALNPLLAKYGVFTVPTVLERTTAQRTTRGGGVMYEVNLHVMFTFYGATGDCVQASAWGEGTDSGDKSTNKAMTMAFKNVLAQTFAISTEDTIDADSHSPEETVRPFNVETDLMPGAHSGKDAPKMIGEAFSRFDPTVDWSATVESVVVEKYGKARERLTPVETQDYWRRLSNAVQWLNNEVPLGDFPPIDAEKIKEGFAYAFSGAVVDVTYKESPPEPENAALTPQQQQQAEKALEEGDEIPFE
jgi:hypothetical protein